MYLYYYFYQLTSNDQKLDKKNNYGNHFFEFVLPLIDVDFKTKTCTLPLHFLALVFVCVAC